MDDERSKARCANCPTAAVAELDGTPLCEGCLLSLILSSRESLVVERIRAIRPLRARAEPPRL
jgi:hypothetical protein